MTAIKVQLSFRKQLIDMVQKVDVTERINFIKQQNFYELKINDDGETLLHSVARCGDVEMTKLLVEAGMNVNAQDISGKTPILLAVEHKPREYLKIIEILYKGNADIHIADKYGKSAAQLALCDFSSTYDHVHKLFLMIIHYESGNNSQNTALKLISLQYPLCQAVLLGNANVLRYMIMHGCPVNNIIPDAPFTALGRAVQLMDLESVKVLIEYGANVDLCDNGNFHPIFYYLSRSINQNQEPEIIKSILNETVMLKDLQQENVIYNLKNAFEFGNRQVIQILLEHHNDILNIRDAHGQTPLHYLSGNPHPDITELLQDQQIDVNVRDKAGRTPLYMATISSFSHMNNFKFLLQKGADVNVITSFHFDLDVLLFSLCQNSSITKEKYFEIIELFLQHELDIQVVGSDGQTTVFDVILKCKSFYKSQPLIAHLAIREEQNIPILEHIRSKIDSHRIFKNCFDVCKAELAKLKNNTIYKNVSLFEIVVNQMTEKKILRSVKFSPSLLSIFEQLKNDFHPGHHYYATIQNCIYIIVSRLKLLQKAAPVLCEILKCINNPYHIVITEIMGYLDNEDLKNLIKIEV